MYHHHLMNLLISHRCSISRTLQHHSITMALSGTLQHHHGNAAHQSITMALSSTLQHYHDTVQHIIASPCHCPAHYSITTALSSTLQHHHGTVQHIAASPLGLSSSRIFMLRYRLILDDDIATCRDKKKEKKGKKIYLKKMSKKKN